MAQCSSCGGELEPGDRFCGTCGAAVRAEAPAPAPGREQAQAPPPPEPEPAIEETPVPPNEPGWDEWEEDAPQVRSRRGLALAGLAAVVILAGATFAWQRGMLPAQEAAVPDPAMAEPPAPEAAPALDEITGALDGVAQAIAGDDGALAGEPLIRPGLWEIVRRVDAVLTPDLADPGIPRDSLPIGNQEQELQCVNAQIAGNPEAYAFPAERAGHCSVGSFTMAYGRYRSRMTCSFMGQRRVIEMDGSYGDTSLDLTMSLELPANELAGESYGTRPLVLRYRVEGHHIGPC